MITPTIIIAKNVTYDDITIDDLGLVIDATSEVTISSIFNISEIVISDDLKTYVTNEDIVINNGSIDLNVENALKEITFETLHEDNAEEDQQYSNNGEEEEVIEPTIPGYTYASNLIIDADKCYGDSITNYPLWVSLAGNCLRTSVGRMESPYGYDLVFADGTMQLDHEMVFYDGDTGIWKGWVRVPYLDCTNDTTITINYGNSDTTSSEENITSVWDSNYKGVWHLEETPTVDSYMYDSTINNNDLSIQSGMTSTDQIDAICEGGLDFDGVNDYLSISNTESLTFTNSLTIDVWFNPNALLSGSSDHFYSFIDAGCFRLVFSKGCGKIYFVAKSTTSRSWSDIGTPNDAVICVHPCGEDNLYIGGKFTTVGGTSADSIAVYNGSTWSALGSSSAINNDVLSLTIYDGKLIAGGKFTGAGGVSGADYIAAWNGSSWELVGAGSTFNSDVQALTVYNGNLIAGGKFTAVDSRDYIAQFNGTSWSSLNDTSMTSDVKALNVYNGELYVGQKFPATESMQKWNGTSWSNVGSGTFVNKEEIDSLSVYNGKLYIGGKFSDGADITDADMLVEWDGSSFNLPTNLVSLGDSILGQCVYNDELYITGKIDTIYRWDGSTWNEVSGIGDDGNALGVWKNDLIVCGIFDNAGGDAEADKLAKYSSGNDIYLETQTISWNTDAWHNISVVIDSDSATLYVDGDEEDSVSHSISIDDLDSDIYFGKSHGTIFQGTGEIPFYGVLDEIRMSNTPRTQEYIQTQYNNISDPDTFYTYNLSVDVYDTVIFDQDVVRVIDSNGNLDINNTTPVAIPFDSIMIIDPYKFEHPEDAITRISVDEPGFYKVRYSVGWRIYSGSAHIRARARKNGDTYIGYSATYCPASTDHLYGYNFNTFLVELDSDDYIEILCDKQGETTSALTIADGSFLELEYIGNI